MSVERNTENSMFAVLHCAIFCTPSLRKSLTFFETSITSLDPETVQLPAFSILSTMFTGVCGPPEKLSNSFAGAAFKHSAHDCETCLF